MDILIFWKFHPLFSLPECGFCISWSDLERHNFFLCSVLLSVRSDLSVPFWVVCYLPHGLLVWNVLEFSRKFRRLRRSILIHHTPSVRPFTCPGSTRPLLLKIYSGGLQLLLLCPNSMTKALTVRWHFLLANRRSSPLYSKQCRIDQTYLTG